MNKDEVMAVIQQYFGCLKNKMVDQMPFGDDVEFDAPTAGPFSGAEEVRAFFSQAVQFIVQVHPKQFVVDGEHAVVIMELETVAGTLPVAEAFHVENGLIKSIRPYYDPRPILTE